MPANARPKGACSTWLNKPIHADQKNQHEIIKLKRIFEIERLHAGDFELGPHGDVDTVRAAAQLSVVKNRVKHLRERKSHHDEIDAGGAQHQTADDQSGRRSGGYGYGKRNPDACCLVSGEISAST